jgi:hypothetical protein
MDAMSGGIDVRARRRRLSNIRRSRCPTARRARATTVLCSNSSSSSRYLISSTLTDASTMASCRFLDFRVSSAKLNSSSRPRMSSRARSACRSRSWLARISPSTSTRQRSAPSTSSSCASWVTVCLTCSSRKEDPVQLPPPCSDCAETIRRAKPRIRVVAASVQRLRTSSSRRISCFLTWHPRSPPP